MALKTGMTFIDELMQACDKIHDNDCIGCPIECECLRYTTVEEFWNSVSESNINSFLTLADTIDEEEEEISEEDAYIDANYLKWKEEYYEAKYESEDK